ncbi:MAG TPA: hypothetical protein DCR93_34085 [Cytophagales bacterium]|nr:hypothetical protein [Cytophagales bacterium]HAP64301.1 hypothetical protein [Cytophagales bacterium]
MAPGARAQTEDPLPFSIELQTDLIAYTTAGGYSAWLTLRPGQNKIAFAFVNYPNRQRAVYAETGIRENDQFARLQVARYFAPTSKLKNFYYGINAEFHWRELVEDGNTSEVLNDTYWKTGPFIGYDWQPFANQENALRNLRIVPWLGLNIRPNNTRQARVFENTASVYPVPGAAQPAPGLNLSYTLFAQPKS